MKYGQQAKLERQGKDREDEMQRETRKGFVSDGSNGEVIRTRRTHDQGVKARDTRRAKHEFHMDDYDVFKQRRLKGTPSALLGRYALPNSSGVPRRSSGGRKSLNRSASSPSSIQVHTYVPNQSAPHASAIGVEPDYGNSRAARTIFVPGMGSASALVSPQLQGSIDRQLTTLKLDKPVSYEVKAMKDPPLWIRSQYGKHQTLSTSRRATINSISRLVGLGLGNWGFRNVDPMAKARDEKEKMMQQTTGSRYLANARPTRRESVVKRTVEAPSEVPDFARYRTVH